MATRTDAGTPAAAQVAIRTRTARQLERATGALATASIARMEERLPWYRAMPPDERSWVGLVIQAGIAAFVDWYRNPGDEGPTVTADVFGTAPRELTRAISLEQTVEMVRVAIDVVEQTVTDVVDDADVPGVREGVLRYSREVAFAAATVYAGAAEARGAWDARLEALVVDGIVRGDAEESLLSRAAALGWDPDESATVLVGTPPTEDPPAVLYGVRSRAARAGHGVLVGVQGSRLVVVVGGSTDDVEGAIAVERLAAAFGDGPVVVGPTVGELADAHRSAVEALSAL